MVRAWSAAVVAMALVLLGSAIGVGASPAATPVRVLSGEFSDPAIVVDSAGAIHVAASRWTGRTADVWYATNRSGDWTSVRVMRGTNIGAFRRPTIALDEDDRVHIAAAGDIDGTGGCMGTTGTFYVTDLGRARGTFATPVMIAPADSDGPSLKVVGGVRYLAYALACSPSGVYLRTNSGAGWTTTRVSLDGFWPSLRVGDDGIVHIAFGRGSKIRYATGPRSGPFATELVGSGFAARPSLALDSADRPAVAWVTVVGEVFFAEAATGGWTARTKLGNGKGVALTIDGLDVPHAIRGHRDVVHHWLDGGTWRQETVVVGVRTEGVAARASSAGLVIAWGQATATKGIYVLTL